MGKVLITGRNGFIANAAKRRFEQAGEEAALLDVRSDAWKQMSFSGVDTLIHTAALVHKNEAEYTLEDYRKVNTDLTLELARKAREEGVRHFVFISTMAVYGVKISCFHSVEVDSETPIAPITKYGISKYEAEQKLQELSSEDFLVSIVRPPFVYGPNCRGNYGVLRKLTLKIGVIPKLSNQKSILYVDNLAEFLYQISARKLAGVFMPQNSRIVSTYEIASLIAQRNGKKVLLSPLFNPMVQLGSLVIHKFCTAFGSEFYSPALSQACGFDYQAVNFEDSIRITEENWNNS